MLKMDTLEAEAPAASIRVTPQELAQATAAIEARQDAHAFHEASTIPIGEAVHQLNLHATPEEVLAEVEKQRQQQSQAQQTATVQKQRASGKTLKILSAIIGLQFIVLGLTTLRFTRENQNLRQQVSDLSSRVYQDAKLLAAATETTQNTHATVPSAPVLDPGQITLLDSNKFRTLDLKEGEKIQCKFDIVEKMATQPAPNSVWMARNPKGVTWELVRHGDTFRVNCWATTEDAQKLMNGGSGIVYANKEGAYSEHPEMHLELPVTAFQNVHVYATTDAPAAVVITGSH